MPAPITHPRYCTNEWCDKPLYSKGMCKNCYERNRNGTLRDPRIPKTIKLCSFEGCGRPASSFNLCGTHYVMQWSGRPLREIRPRREVPERPGERQCRTCGEWKDREECFYNTSSTPSHAAVGKQSECKACMADRARNNKLKKDEEKGLLVG
jgi:hypothetical protein